MKSTELNEEIATKWFDAFNRHDLEDLLALYDDDAIHTSPKLKIQFPESEGSVKGKKALRKWWQDSFARFPDLHYEVKIITPDRARVFMEYQRQVAGEADLMVVEILVIKNGKIISSTVHYSH